MSSRSPVLHAASLALAAGSLMASANPAAAVLSATLDASAYSPGPGTLRGNPVPYTLGYRFNVPAAGATISGLGYILETSSSVPVRVYSINTVTGDINVLGTVSPALADPTVQTAGGQYTGGDRPVTQPGQFLTYHIHTLDKPLYLTPQADTIYAMSADTAEDDNWYEVNKLYPNLVHVNPGITYIGAVDRRTEVTQTPTTSYLYGTNPYFAWWNGTMDLGAQWVGASSADWGTSPNWSTVVPDGTGQSATFASATSPNRNVNLVAARTLGSMIFASTASYSINGSGSITFGTTAPTASVSVLAGSHSVGVPVTLNNDFSVDSAASTAIAFTGGVSGTGKAVTTTGLGTVSFANLRVGATRVSGGILRISQKSSPNQTGGTSSATSLSVSNGATLDLTNNSFILDYTTTNPTTDIRTALHDGLISTSTDTTGAFKIGYVDNASLTTPLGTFGGLSVDSSSVLLKYTRSGDATLDGTVNFDDLLILAQNYNTSDKVWSQGDSNYDGLVNFDDLLSLAQNYNQSLLASEAGLLSSSFAADFALAQSLVPEPTSLLAIAGLASLSTRRRRAIDRLVG